MLKYRLVSGALLLGLLAVIAFVDHLVARIVFAGLCAFVVWGSLREYFALVARLGHGGFPRLTLLASLAFLAAAFAEAGAPARHQVLEVGILLLYLLAGFGLVFRHRDLRQGVLNLAVSLGGLCYLGWTLAFLVRVYAHGDGRQGTLLFFFLILVTKCGDIGGYVLGLTTARRPRGNHKMTPVLSPKKSWEGFVGSLLFSAIAGALIPLLAGGALLSHDAVAVTPLSGALLGLVLAAVGLIGDLAESALKRAAGVKDSGNTLPGMGGVLDVIDSLVFVGPLGYAYLLLIGA